MYLYFFKRFFDILISIVLLPFVLIVSLIVIPFIYFEDKGPVFYNANRIGRYGKPFLMHKFRTMRVNSPDIRLDGGWSTYISDDDPRVTRAGHFLRKSSIDELPQIYNVLKGEMSLIGPRPDPVDWLDNFTDEEKIFWTVKPGITGYNQAFFRNSVDGRTKLNNDIFYAKNISLQLDVKILFKSVWTVVFRKNINRESSKA
jgi:undecaprenyl phosphate N,N'-diacetylbacillosamine 1-phosphate transferase